MVNCANKNRSYEIIRVASLSVIAALVKKDDSDVINFLIKTKIIPVILKNMEKGTEIIRKVACFIIQRIIEDINGFKYICEFRERLFAIIYVLNLMLKNKLRDKLIKNILKIYLCLIENKEAKSLIKQQFPKILKDKGFIQNLDDNSKAKFEILIKSLEEEEAGTEIIKLKNELSNNNNINIIQNINIINNNNINIYNNGNQMNLKINNDMNNKNINMMLINSMNQMTIQPGFMMTPNMGDYNYNVYNDNESYMNSNIYNQNLNNGFPNFNFYNSYKNV